MWVRADQYYPLIGHILYKRSKYNIYLSSTDKIIRPNCWHRHKLSDFSGFAAVLFSIAFEPFLPFNNVTRETIMFATKVQLGRNLNVNIL